jgi:hypothetical protein
MYDDLCMGRVSGVEADPRKLEYWQRLVKLRATGHDVSAGSIPDAQFWHPEVLARRERAKRIGGLRVLDRDVVGQAIFGDEPEQAEPESEADPIFGNDLVDGPKKRGKGK